MSVGEIIAAIAVAASIIGGLFGLIFKLAINGSVQRGRSTHELLVRHIASTDESFAYLRARAETTAGQIAALHVTAAQVQGDVRSLDQRVQNIEGNRWRRRDDEEVS